MFWTIVGALLFVSFLPLILTLLGSILINIYENRKIWGAIGLSVVSILVLIIAIPFISNTSYNGNGQGGSPSYTDSSSRVEQCKEEVEMKYRRIILDSCGMPDVPVTDKEAIRRCFIRLNLDTETDNWVAGLIQSELDECELLQ